MNEQEEAFIKAFITPDKRERYLRFVASPKRRDKFLNDFYHNIIFDVGVGIELSNLNLSLENVETWLRERGAGDQAYIISPSDKVDRQWFPLSEILFFLASRGIPGIVCCKIGELAFFLSEEDAWLLHQPKTKTSTGRAKR